MPIGSYTAVALGGSLRRALHIWERRTDEKIAEQAEFRGRMSSVFSRSGKALEHNAPITPKYPAGKYPAGRVVLSAEERDKRAERVKAHREALVKETKEAEAAALKLWSTLRMWRWYRVWRARAEERSRKQQVGSLPHRHAPIGMHL